MKPSCAFSIVVLFITGMSTPLVETGSTTSSTKAVSNSTASSNATTSATGNSSTSSLTTTVTATTGITVAATTSQTTTPSALICINHTCSSKGCLTNATNWNSTHNCTGSNCRMVQRFNGTDAVSYTITADCADTCMENDAANGTYTVRTRCCQINKCNNDDNAIKALEIRSGGSAGSKNLLWILSITFLVSAFPIL